MQLSRTDTSAMKGLAILGIMLHNYCHFLYKMGAVQENEFRFFSDRPMTLLQRVAEGDNILFVDLCSFFGCYGVPLFLFVSGFGLVMKYEKKGAEAKPLPFIGNHFWKLFKLMIGGYLLFMLLMFTKNGDLRGYSLQTVVAQLLMVINLLPSPQSIIKPGPYWFFSLMIQLYIIYRLLLYRRHWGITLALMAVCTAVQMFCTPESDTLNYLRYNAVGSVLPFGAGVLYARFASDREVSMGAVILLTLVSLVGVNLSVLNYYSWFFTPLFIIGATIGIVKLLRGALLNAVAWVGVLSSFLFVAHPIVREMTVWQYGRWHQYWGIIVYLLSAFALAMLMKTIYDSLKKYR